MNQELLRLSPSSRYALQGLVHLAQRPKKSFSLVAHSAERYQLPKDFLAKIFQRLAHHGLLMSKRGPGGGYALLKDPSQIYIDEILQYVEGPWEGPFRCALAERTCNSVKPCALHTSVVKAAKILKNALSHITLADLAEGRAHGLL